MGRTRISAAGTALALSISAAPALAQDQASELAFVGGYAGPEIGVHEHHVYLGVTDLKTGETSGRYYRGWGVGGGAFVGYDLAVAKRVRVGLEAGISVSGTGPYAAFPDGTYYTQRPRYGLRGTARVGTLIGDRLLAYGTFGYGGHRYRLDSNAPVLDTHEWGSSFTIGGGLEYRLSSRAGLRLDFRHLDNQMSHLLVGLPVRF